MNALFDEYMRHRKIAWTVMAGLLFFVTFLADNSATLWFISWLLMWVCVILASILPDVEPKPDKVTEHLRRNRKQQEETNERSAPASIWPDGIQYLKPHEKEWFIENMKLAGFEFDEDKAPTKHSDVGKSFPVEEVKRFECYVCGEMRPEREGFEIHAGVRLRCHQCIEEERLKLALAKRYQGECHHTGSVETTTIASGSRTHVCADCGKQLGYTTPEVKPETKNQWQAKMEEQQRKNRADRDRRAQ
jgi:hypothetical protein